MQNEAGVLLVLFLYSVSYVCLVQNDENFKRSLELCFPSRVLQKSWENTSAPLGEESKGWDMYNTSICARECFSPLIESISRGGHQISTSDSQKQNL